MSHSFGDMIFFVFHGLEAAAFFTELCIMWHAWRYVKYGIAGRVQSEEYRCMLKDAISHRELRTAFVAWK